MIKCPKCKADLLDDSSFCDQCGEKLMFCPQCGDGRPRRGKRCTQCGALLSDCRDVASPQQSPKSQEPDFTSIDGIMAEFGKHFGQNLGKTTEPSQSSRQGSPQSDYVIHSPIFGDINVKGSSSGTMRPQPQGGTMRPQAQGGTMRPQQVPVSDEPSRLVMVDDPTKIAVLQNGAVIGRRNGQYVDVFGGCPYVSGTHAKITLHSSGAWLYTDLGSTNGTKVGNTNLEPNKNYRLRKGQVIEIGFVKFRVE